jgi:L-amino acid N-acyltransferase YncA
MLHQSHEAEIRAAAKADSPAIASIYNHYVTQTVVTFEEEPISAVDIARRMDEVWSASLPWLVAQEGSDVVGYAYATPWRSRTGYRFSSEITVYLKPERVGRGIGSTLYAHLFPLLLVRGVHAVIGGIALPNEASVALHEKFGMRKVAHFEQVGFKFDRWIDVGYWQRTFTDPIRLEA